MKAATRSGLLLFVLLGATWGSSYSFIKVCLRGLSPGQLVLARLVLGAAVLLAVLAARRTALPAGAGVWAHIIVAAALGLVAPFLLLAWGERYTSAAMAGVLIAAFPLMTLAATALLLPAERAGWRQTAGIVGGFAGVMLVMSPWHTGTGSLRGQLAVLGAAACYAAQIVYVRRFLSHRAIAALPMTAASLLAAAVLQAAVTLLTPWHAPSLGPQVEVSILGLGVLGTGLAYVLYFRLINELGATTASAVNYLEAVVALLVSTVVLGDRITWNMVAGIAVVLASLAMAEERFARVLSRRTAAEPVSEPVSPR